MKKIIVLIYIIILIKNSFANDPFGLWNVSEEFRNTTWEGDIIKSISPSIEFLIGFIWIFSLIFVMKWWFQIMTASWDEEKVKSWKKTLIFSLIGLFISLVAFTLVTSIWINSLKEIDEIN